MCDVPHDAPVQRRAAQRTVRRNQLLASYDKGRCTELVVIDLPPELVRLQDSD
jgi:hypothetical protein